MLRAKSDAAAAEKAAQKGIDMHKFSKTIAATGEVEKAVTFKDVVQRFAEEHGFDFLPHLSRPSFEGKQLYKFGAATIYLHSDVVFAEDRVKKNTFTPVSFEELLTLATK